MQLLARLYVGLLRFGFRLLYNEMAWTYDLVSWSVSMGHWRRWQQASIPHLGASDGGSVLELAHGTANLQIDMQQEGFATIGLDISPFMGQIARRKLSKNQLTYRLVRANAYHLPFPDKHFQAVVSTFPTEFFFHKETLSEVHRVLADEGRYVVVPNGLLTLKGPVSEFLEWLYQVTGQRGPWPDDFLKGYQEVGFEVEQIEEVLDGSIVTLLVARKSSSTSEGTTDR